MKDYVFEINGKKKIFHKTNTIIRMCDCGTDTFPPSGFLDVYSDGKLNIAHCEICNKTWDVDTLKEIK